MNKIHITPLHRTGLLVALIVLIADLASKEYFYNLLFDPMRQIMVTSFFNLTAVWNYGVSFGLMRADSVWGWVQLLILTALITGFVLYWLYRAKNKTEAVACGAILGGALGNIHDRIRFGAVRDFFDLYYAQWHWPAFNIADAAIVCGVLFLLFSAVKNPAK